MYILVGFLALKAGRTEDPSEAMAWLGSGWGKAVVAAMAVGFLFYGIWRLASAWLDSDGKGSDLKGLGPRIAAAGSGIIHLGFCYYAVKIALGSGGRGGGSGAESGTATALSFPGGEFAIYVAGAVLVGAGLVQLDQAVRLRFLKHMKAGTGSPPWICWTGRIGYAARGVIFLVAAWLLVHAGMHHNPGEAGGVGDSLAAVPDALRPFIAAGLGVFGLLSLIEAKYRKINTPRVGAEFRRMTA